MHINSRSANHRLKAYGIFTSLLVIVLIGCSYQRNRNNESVSFETLCGLTYTEFESINSQQLEQWIKKKQVIDIQTSTQKTSDNISIIAVYQWAEDGMNKSATLKDDHVLHIDNSGISGGPTFGDIVTGLGNPIMVYRHAEAHEQILYNVELDYPGLGVSVGTSSLVPISDVVHGDGWAVRLNESMKVDYISCYALQNSMELVLENDFLYPPSMVKIQLQRRESWPNFGSWLTLSDIP